MEFRILGPLEVRDGEREIALGGPRPRALLAVLLTRANEVVRVDRLIDEIWGEEPPETAANVLQGHVSQLRKALGAGVIETRPAGYALVLGEGELDLHRFEKLASEGSRALLAGRLEEAAERLRHALALWRGPALADVAMEPFARAEIARLEELRLAALERRIEADLALGSYGELVAELEALVVRHPLRERLRAHLMLALYRSGRQAEALGAYRTARRTLVDELGIEPSPPLQELERRILRQDPSLESATGQGSSPAPIDPPAECSIMLVAAEESNIDALVSVAEPLARRPGHELVLVRLIGDGDDLPREAERLQGHRAALAARHVPARTVVHTTLARGDDTVLLATELTADLLLVDAPPTLLEDGIPDPDLAAVLAAAPCDVGVLVASQGAVLSASKPVVVPFGGAQHEWTAAELAAWIARSVGARLKLVGVTADDESGRPDASRLLAQVSLLLQRVVGVDVEPALVTPGTEGVVEAAEGAGLIVVGLSERWRSEGLGEARLAVVRASAAPVIVVRRGLRPGALAPRDSLTRFTWSISTAEA